MVNLMQLLKPVVTAFVLFVAALQPQVVNSQGVGMSPEEIDALLLRLRDAPPVEALNMAEHLKREWSISGSATADFLLRRGRDAMERGEPEVAVEHFTALVDHAPGFAQGWAERARAYFELDLYGPAVGDLEQVLALNPRHFEAIMGLAVILDSMDRIQDAYDAYLQVKAIHPNQPGLTDALERLEPLVQGRDL